MILKTVYSNRLIMLRCICVADFITCSDDVLVPLPDLNDLDMQSRKFAYEHFTYIAGVLPFVTDKKRRCEAITQITEERRIPRSDGTLVPYNPAGGQTASCFRRTPAHKRVFL